MLSRSITAIIDARGRVVERGKQFGVAVVTGSAQPFSGATPWVRFGNMPVLAACLLLLLLPAFVLNLPAKFPSV